MRLQLRLGGMYYNVSDVTSMDKIYEEIYQMEKQLYLVEFEDNTGATVRGYRKYSSRIPGSIMAENVNTHTLERSLWSAQE